MSSIWEFISGLFEIPKTFIKSLGEPLTELINLCCTPLSFDWTQSLMTAMQGVAIGIVVIIVIVRGIVTGILLEGGSEDESIGHYIFTSFVPVALIAACPVIVAAITQATSGMLSSFINASDVGDALATSWIDQVSALFDSYRVDDNSATSGIFATWKMLDGGLVIGFILVIISLYYLVCISMQCLKRWIQLEVLSVIMPLVAIMTALEDSGDYIALLKSMFMTGVITILQLAGLVSIGGLMKLGADSLGMIFLMVAGLGAIKQIPAWIEKYTNIASVAGHGNNASKMLVPVRMASQVARVAK